MICETCGKDFKEKRKWQKYCSVSCRWKAWDKRHPRTKSAATMLALFFLLTTPALAQPGFATYYTKASCQKEGTSRVWTASGEPYQENAFTCALPHHRFGGRYRVQSVKTGRAVVVRHNDYGPGRSSRRKGVVIDLTPHAFASLGHSLSDGKIAVTVEALP